MVIMLTQDSASKNILTIGISVELYLAKSNENGIYPPLVQVIGGAILSVTAYVGYCNFKIGEENIKIGRKNLKVTEEKQVTERFSKAIEHLGNDKAIEIRLGGIYTLKQIAIDSPNEYHWTVMDILSAFMREKLNYIRSFSVMLALLVLTSVLQISMMSISVMLCFLVLISATLLSTTLILEQLISIVPISITLASVMLISVMPVL